MGSFHYSGVLVVLISHIANVNCDSSPLGIDALKFLNHGKVDSSEKFKLVNLQSNYQEGYMYQDDPLNNNDISTGSLNYLFKIQPNGSYSVPPSGMRSAVPFGSMGGGIFEMRGDGRFTDSLIFNNGPGASPSYNWHKMDLNEMMFAMTINSKKDHARILRTQLETKQELSANLQNHAIDSLHYEGAYPTARLRAVDSSWDEYHTFSANLTAFSAFKPYDINMSTTPGVIFAVDLINDGEEDITVDLLFNFPDQGILFDAINALKNNGFTINKNGNLPSSGNISMSTYQCTSSKQCIPLNAQYYKSDSLQSMWNTFVSFNETVDFDNFAADDMTQYSLMNRDIKVAGNSVVSVVFSFSYFFPFRTWDDKIIGQFYSNLFADSVAVNDFMINNLDNVITNTMKWHELIYNDTQMPDFVKDFLVNIPSYLQRTSMYTVDGRWRQLEAFDCDQVEPPHVGFYRKLPIQLLFTELDQNILSTLYIEHMIASNGMFGEQGMVSENFGGSCGDPGKITTLDTPNGDPRGDDNPVFILDIYMNWKWASNGDVFMNASYHAAKMAMYYSMNNAITNKYSLPWDMVNTFDEHGAIGNVNSYNSVIYIVTLYAMKEMSTELDDTKMVNILNDEIANAKGNLTSLLWNAKPGNFISFWCENGLYPKSTLQGDTLYGLVWKYVLDIDIEMSDELQQMFVSHLKTENEWNLDSDGHGVMFNVNMSNYTYHCAHGNSVAGGFDDQDKWEDFTLNSGTLYVYMLNDTDTAFEYYQMILDKYAHLYHDQWDYRILSHDYYTQPPEMGTDRPGGDMAGSPHILQKPDYNLCWEMCNNTNGCVSWTYVVPQCISTIPDPECWLKSSIPSPVLNECTVSGTEHTLSESRPGCTSHYDRQLIGHSLLLALNGQKYDRRHNYRKLSLAPLKAFEEKGDCITLMISHSSSLVCVVDRSCYRFHVLFGELHLDELNIYNQKINLNHNSQKSLLLKQDESRVVCSLQ